MDDFTSFLQAMRLCLGVFLLVLVSQQVDGQSSKKTRPGQINEGQTRK